MSDPKTPCSVRSPDCSEILEAIDDAVVLISSEGRILYVNGFFEDLLEVSRDKITGMNSGDFAERFVSEIVFPEPGCQLRVHLNLPSGKEPEVLISSSHTPSGQNLVTFHTGDFSHEQGFYHAIFEKSPLPLILLDASGLKASLSDPTGDAPDYRAIADSVSVLDVNESTLQLMGTNKRKYCVGQIKDWPGMGEVHRISVMAMTENNEHSLGEAVIRNFRYEEKYVLLHIAYISDRDLLILSLIDITHLRRAREALRKRGERFGSLVRYSSDIIAILSPEATLQYLSPSVQRVLGYKPGDLIGKTFFSYIHPEERDYASQMFEEMLNINGEVTEPDYRFRRADGTYANLESIVVNMTDDPSIQGIVINTRDVSERVHAEEELRERNAQLMLFNEIISAATEPIALDQVLDKVLRKTLPLLGCEGGGIYLTDPGTLRARLCTSAGLPGPYMERLSSEFGRLNISVSPDVGVFVEGATVFESLDYNIFSGNWQAPMLRDAGFRSFIAAPLISEGGIIGSIFVLSKESGLETPEVRALVGSISRQVGSLIGHARLQKMAEEAYDSANLYLDIMSHDINNANTVALGYGEMLSGMTSGEEKEVADKLLSSLWQSNDIIRNVSTLRMLRDSESDLSGIELDEIIRREISYYPDIRIIYEGTDAVVMADGLLSEVFTNLIGNSVKFGGCSSVIIYISVRDEMGMSAISVADNGPGIPDSEKPFVFERLRRGGTKKGGKGLGLYIVRNLIERYGGCVYIRDRVKGDSSSGAEFVILLRPA